MVKVKKHITKSYQETIDLGASLATSLQKGSIVAFYGDLGTGKTTLVKGIVKALETKNSINVNSPTFIYLNIYNLKKYPTYHFDLYRIKNKNHFYAMGFEEYFTNNGICLIEWAENINDILPKNTIIIKMKHLSENKREISISRR